MYLSHGCWWRPLDGAEGFLFVAVFQLDVGTRLDVALNLSGQTGGLGFCGPAKTHKFTG